MPDRSEIIAAILQLCPEWKAEGLSNFEYLPGGYSNDNYAFRYRQRQYVLRLPQQGRVFIDRELELRFYRQHSFELIPTIERFDADSGRMISNWVDGKLLCDAVVEATTLVPYLLRLHGGQSPCGRSYDPISLSRDYLRIGSAPRHIVQWAESQQWQPEHITTCHNDLNPWNIICGVDGSWTTLDWEWLGSNDPVFDLVTLHQGLSLNDDLLPDLVNELTGDPSSSERLLVCYSAFWLREYAWAHAEIAGGSDREEIHQQLRVSSERLEQAPGFNR